MVLPGKDTSPETNAGTKLLENFLEGFPVGEVREAARNALAVAFSEGVAAGMEATGAMHEAITMGAVSAEAERTGVARPHVRTDIPPAVHEARAKFRATLEIEANPYEDALKGI